LSTLLLRQQQLAELQGQTEVERDAVLRLGTLLPGLGQQAEAVELLSTYCAQHQSDVDATTRWAELAFDDANWPVAVTAYTQLVPLLIGADKLHAVLRLAESAEQGGQPLLAKEALEAAYAEQPNHEE